jgi:hypothetical protein
VLSVRKNKSLYFLHAFLHAFFAFAAASTHFPMAPLLRGGVVWVTVVLVVFVAFPVIAFGGVPSLQASWAELN